jgi:glutamate N-acetyltransferase/amino-acid N-acetyltransferase
MMEEGIEFIPSGTVTSAAGFSAGAASAGIKKDGSLDIGLLFCEVTSAAAGLFTTNCVKAAPVVLSQQRLRNGKASALVANSGCANACTGEAGLADAVEMAGLAAKGIGVSTEDVLVASTGVIGQHLPMEKIREGIGKIALTADGGHELARAIMTTDTVPKECAVKAGEFIIGGVAKGSGMIHPDLATFLCFLTTDAEVEINFLQLALRRVADISFNMVSIDGDTSTNDMVLLMASGKAGGEAISEGSGRADLFQRALDRVCVHLARAVARDGEGATKLVEVAVRGAPGVAEARKIARTIAGSQLVKAAVYGNDPNWGRIIAAAGRSGVELLEAKVDLYLGDLCVFKSGVPLPVKRKEAAKKFDSDDVYIGVDLNTGEASAVAWGCDLTEKYVTINSEYTT